MFGTLRKQIMSNCPEAFEEELKDIIDGIEHRLSDIKDKMQIKSLSDLSRIEEAYDDLDKFIDELCF